MAMMGLMRYNLDVTRALPPATEFTKYAKEQEPKSTLNFEKTSGNSQRTPAAVRWPQGFSPCRKGRKPSLAYVTANVTRRAGTKRPVLDSNAQAVQMRARLELRGVKLKLLRPGTPQKVWREGWGLGGRAAKCPAEDSLVGLGRRRRYPRAREPPLQPGEEPVARRRRSTPQPRVGWAGASRRPSSVQ